MSLFLVTGQLLYLPIRFIVINILAHRRNFRALSSVMGFDLETDSENSLWSGHYWLGDHAVPFSAWITIINGRLTGTTLEPVPFECGQDGDDLQAAIRGHASPEEIAFLKQYTSFEHEPAYYEGELSDEGDQILGRWFFGWPDEVSGAFELSLKSARAPVEQDRRTDVRSFK